MNLNNKNNNDSLFTINDIFLIIASKFKIVVLVPCIFCLLMIIYVTFFTRSEYSSISKIMSSNNNSSNSISGGLAAQFGINLSQNNDRNIAYSEILKSRTIVKRLLKKEFYSKKKKMNQKLIEIIMDGENISKSKDEFKIQESRAATTLSNMIMVNEDQKTQVFTIKVNAFDPKLACDINEGLIDVLEEHQQEYYRSKTSKAKIFINKRIIDTEKELKKIEESLKDFNDRNRRIENSPNLQLERQRLQREVSVLTGVYTTLRQNLENTKIEEVKESSYVIILDLPEVPLFRSKPQKKLLVIISGILGLIIGILIVFILDSIEKSNVKERNKLLKAKKLIFDQLFSFLPKNFKRE